MLKEDLSNAVERQRTFFRSGETMEFSFRKSQLDKLWSLITENEDRIHKALASDLHKPTFEAFATETGQVLSEIRHALQNLKQWMKPKKTMTPLSFFPATSSIRCEPRGVALIIAPWNYPFQLIMAPLVGSISAGNCTIVKPSELAPATSEVIKSLLTGCFQSEYVLTVTGDAEVGKELLTKKFDHIFFTGSTTVGISIASAAAKSLTPVTLELGGKSPTIIDDTANLTLAARRIVWGKFLNAGQTCIAPDYVLVPKSLKSAFVSRVTSTIKHFYSDNSKSSPDYSRIINERNFNRLLNYLEEGRVLVGGEADRNELFIAPTVIDDLPMNAKALQEEIFGPILPLVTYETLDDAIEWISQHPDPLALYIFSNNRTNQAKLLKKLPFGGGVINDVLIHFSNPELPFGGRGRSGVGNYHGKFSFETFSHRKPIVNGSTLFDPKLRYPPYRNKLQWLKKLMR